MLLMNSLDCDADCVTKGAQASRCTSVGLMAETVSAILSLCSMRMRMQVQWIHKESGTVLTSDDRVEVDNVINEVVDGQTKYDVARRHDIEGAVTYQLIVRRLVKTDGGMYTCQIIIVASNENDHPSKDGEIIVLGRFRSFVVHRYRLDPN